MTTIVKIISWIFSAVFGIAGIANLSRSPLMGMVFLVIAIIIFPKTKELVQKKLGYDFSWKVKSGVIIGLLLVAILVTPKSGTPTVTNSQGNVANESGPSTNNQPPTPPVPQQNRPVIVKTDQEVLEDNLRSMPLDNADVSYRSLEVEKADPDRPKDTKMITVSYNISSFLNRSSLLRNTGTLSAQLFQLVFSSNINAYDVIVWYYGKTKDRYGNEKNDVVLSYAMDKPTFSKINWQNFDAKTLCDFLKQEQSIDPGSGNNCVELVKIN